MTQQTETKVSRAYDGGIVILGALLLIAALVAAVYLLSVAVKDAPVASAIFGVLFVCFCITTVIGVFSLVRWAISQNAAVHTQVADSLGQALAQYKSQNPAPAQPMVLAEPARAQLIDVPRRFNNGMPPGASGVRVSDGATQYTASTASLVAALTILARGEDPTRTHFKEQGIYSSMEAAGAVDFLASLGYIDPVVQGAPAQWAQGVLPGDVGAIADHLRGYVPALPEFQPVFPELTHQAGQAGNKAGRKRR